MVVSFQQREKTNVRHDLANQNYTWLVTGAAGFIGSHLVEKLVQKGQNVIGLDNKTTNIPILDNILTHAEKQRFQFIDGDIRDKETAEKSCANVDFVLHHAAIGSVPHSFDDPSYVNSVNVGGFLNILQAAAEFSVKKFIYASSSAIYGDYTNDPNKESQPAKPLSPYAVSKYTNELYAKVLSQNYNIDCTGLRYFNIYGARQDPNGPYAAVIPKWINLMQRKMPVEIYGDGEIIRDFCFVDDVVQANIAAAFRRQEQSHEVYNIASGQPNSLNELFVPLKEITNYQYNPLYKGQRQGDIKVSLADTTKAKGNLGFTASTDLRENLRAIIKGNRKSGDF